ncbi:MAG: DUF899 domain-containing protein [Phycisphaerales bacterium]|nr:DUF899 domain-containing protein [Phycisphaerales bacterium]
MTTHKDIGHSPFGSQTARVDELELKMMELRKELTTARNIGASIPSVEDYEFRDSNGATVRLSELFGDHDDLVVIHNMGESCQYCALWADGLSAFAPHIARRAALVLASPNSPASLMNQINKRGWKFRVISDAGTRFARDMGFEGQSVSHSTTRLPGVSAFHRERDATLAGFGRIHRVGAAQFGPGDEFCAIWPIFDLITGGVGGWVPVAPYAVGSS